MKRAACFLAAAGISACSTEPLRAPEVPAVEQYTSTAVAEERLAPGKDIPAQWWLLFRSPTLDALVRRALDNSPTLARAQAKMRQAEEDLNARKNEELQQVYERANRVVKQVFRFTPGELRARRRDPYTPSMPPENCVNTSEANDGC